MSELPSGHIEEIPKSVLVVSFLGYFGVFNRPGVAGAVL